MNSNPPRNGWRTRWPRGFGGTSCASFLIVLALAVEGLPAMSPDIREERKGPKVGAPDKAIDGFLRGAGLARDQRGFYRLVDGDGNSTTVVDVGAVEYGSTQPTEDVGRHVFYNGSAWDWDLSADANGNGRYDFPFG